MGRMASGSKQQEQIPYHLSVPVFDTSHNFPPIVTNYITGQVVPIDVHGDCDSEQEQTTALERRMEDNLHISPQSFMKNLHDQQNGEQIACQSKHYVSANGVEMYAVDENGDSLLHSAIIMDYVEVSIEYIDLAINEGMLNLQNNLFQTPLHIAVLNGIVSVVERLVRKNARIDLQDHHGNTPLHLACAKGNLKIVSVLLESSFLKQAIETRNADGVTCVHIAALNNHLDVLGILLEKGANVNARESKSGRTVLHFAAEAGNIRLLDFLFSCSDVNINAENYEGATALQLSRWHGYGDVIMRCLHNAAMVDKKPEGSPD